MIAFIIICVVVFIVIVISLNFQNIKGWFSKGPKDKPQKEAKPIQPIEPDLNYSEPEPQEKKVDSLKREEEIPVYTEESFVKATETELDELSNKKKSGGRLNGDIKSVNEIKVEVENVGDETSEEDELDEIIRKKRASSISDQIKNLPPELKALLVSDVLKRKDEE